MKWLLISIITLSYSFGRNESFSDRYNTYKDSLTKELSQKTKPLEDQIKKLEEVEMKIELSSLEIAAKNKKEEILNKGLRQIESEFGKEPNQKDLDYQLAYFRLKESVWEVDRDANLAYKNVIEKNTIDLNQLKTKVLEEKAKTYNQFYPNFVEDYFEGDRLLLSLSDKKIFCRLKESRFKTQKDLSRAFHEIKAHEAYAGIKTTTKYERRIHKQKIHALKDIEKVLTLFTDFKPADDVEKKKWLNLNSYKTSKDLAIQELETIEKSFVKKKRENTKLKKKFKSRGLAKSRKFKCSYDSSFITLDEKAPSEIPY